MHFHYQSSARLQLDKLRDHGCPMLSPSRPHTKKASLLVVGLVLMFFSHAHGQSQAQNDSVVAVMCQTLLRADGYPDSTKVIIVFQEHLKPYLSRFPENQAEEIWSNIYFRLQRNCSEFRRILQALRSPSEEWNEVGERPVSKLNKKTCREFLQQKNCRYVQAPGDTVMLTVNDGYWIDHFKDGTYSKLKFTWIDECEFEIEFIESNNDVRKNFSKPGDRYRYQLLEQKDNYYSVSAQIVGTASYALFKILYD